MIDRNTPNNELLSNIRGLHIDCLLMREHLRGSIKKYLDANFLVEGEWFSRVKLHSLKFKGDDFKIVLVSKQLLSYREIKSFEDEFSLCLVSRSIEVNDNNSFFRNTYKYNEYLKENSKIFYMFQWDKKVEDFGYAGEIY